MRQPLRRTLLAVLLIVAASWSTSVSGAPPAAPPGPVLRLQRGVFDPLQSQPALPAGLTLSGFPHAGRTQTVVQFNGPIQPGWRLAVEALGVQVLDYVPDFAFLVMADAGQRAALWGLPAVRYVGPWQPAYRIANSLDQALAGEAGSVKPPLTLVVRTVPGADAEEFGRELRSLGTTVLKHSPDAEWGDLWRVLMPADQIAPLARRDEVIWIEEFHERQLANDLGRSIMKVADVQSAYQTRGTLLYGGSQMVGVADTGLDLGSTTNINADFAGRVIKIYALGRQGDGSDPDGHGTHVAGSVLGSGVNSGSHPGAHSYGNSFAGTAPEARLVFQSVEDSQGGLSGIPDNLNELFTPPYNDGVRVHTNSWGGPTGGTPQNPEYGGYDITSQTADQFLWDHQDMTVLFAAHNYGTDQREPFGVVDLDSITSPGTAKNVITVGASESVRATSGADTWGNGWPNDYGYEPIKSDHISNNAQGMAAFSGRGPTDDGRIKPDVVGPGTNIISVRSHHSEAGTGWGVYDDNYIYMGGTSMSTPLVAGATAVIRQFWTDAAGVVPSGALVKATLLNGAANMAPGQYGSGDKQEIPYARPNVVAGWGRVDLAGSLADYPGQELIYADNTTGLNTNGRVVYVVTMPATSAARQADRAFHVTVSWFDYPGNPAADGRLVNDLDLEVVVPGGTRFYGNGASAPIRDRRNTNESVDIGNAQPGVYKVIVKGYNVPEGPQPYAVVMTGPGLIPGLTEPVMRVYLPVLTRNYSAAVRPTPTATPTLSGPTPTATETVPVPTPTATPIIVCDEYVVNGAFEDGFAGWSLLGIPELSEHAYQGDYSAWLGGYDNGNDWLGQDIAFPADVTSARLTVFVDLMSQGPPDVIRDEFFVGIPK